MLKKCLHWIGQLGWNHHEQRPNIFLRISFVCYGLFLIVSIIDSISINDPSLPSKALYIDWNPSHIDLFILSVADQTLISVTIVGSIALGSRWFDWRRLHLATPASWHWIAVCLGGIGVGIGLFSSLILIGLTSGWLAIGDTFTGLVNHHFSRWLFGVVVLSLWIGIREEVFWRWFFLQNVAESLAGWWIITEKQAVPLSVAISSIGFGLWHLESHSSFQYILFVILFGIVLGILFAITESLALPIGLHAGWDLIVVYLMPLNASSSSAIITITGPSLWGSLYGYFHFIVLLSVLLIDLGWNYWKTGTIYLNTSLRVS
jgi:membrane protease YdiL (CAAX protease family)